jgi:purine-binding chemotaxis protein CheW
MSSNQVHEIKFKEEASKTRQYLAMRLGSQLFGMRVDNVQDVLPPMEITSIPLSPPEVKGVLNLRGRIVTAINLRAILGMEAEEQPQEKYRSVVLESEGNLYSIIIDSASEVLDISDSNISRLPENITQKWRDISFGVYSMEKELMIFLDEEKLLDIEGEKKEGVVV